MAFVIGNGLPMSEDDFWGAYTMTYLIFLKRLLHLRH